LVRGRGPRHARLVAAHGDAFHRGSICAGACSASGDAKVVGSLDAGESSIECIAFAPDSKCVAVASMGGTATAWSPDDLKLRQAMAGPAGVVAVKWHPNRPFGVTACADGAVRVWDIRNGTLLGEMPGHEDVIAAMDVTPVDGADSDLMIVSASDDRTVRLWAFVDSPALTPA
jgi:WD40 repeat protein